MKTSSFDDLLREAVIEFADRKYAQMIPSISELDEIIKPSARFKRRMAKMIRTPIAYVRNLQRPLYIRILRRAAIVVVIITMLFGSVMMVPAARAKVIEFVRSWFSDHTQYSVVSETPAEMPERVEFGYIPDGYEPEFADLGELQLFYIFRNEDGKRIDVTLTSNSTRHHIDNEHSEFYTTAIGSLVIDVYESTDQAYSSTIVAYYEDRGLMLTVSGRVAIDELTKVLENCIF